MIGTGFFEIDVHQHKDTREIHVTLICEHEGCHSHMICPLPEKEARKLLVNLSKALREGGEE